MAASSRRPWVRPALASAGWLGLAAGALALAAALSGLPRLARQEWPRCYWLAQPLTRVERTLLERSFFECTPGNCRVTVRQKSDIGWVCFITRPEGKARP